MVLERAITEGFFSATDAVQSKLGHPLPLGYCNAGDNALYIFRYTIYMVDNICAVFLVFQIR